MTQESLFSRIGGEAAIEAAVDIFYDKVMADPRVNHFFDGVDIVKQRKKQKNFLNFAFGGPHPYSGVGMRNAHKKLVNEKGLNDSHFDIIIEHLGSTLKALNVDDNLIAEAAAIAESTRKDVLAG